jgi:DNA-binding CsgD family transcriptional regulator
MSTTVRNSGIVAIQDRSRLYRESFELLMPSDSPIHEVHAVTDGAALTELCQALPIGAVVFEAVEVPWNVGDLIERLKGLLEDPVLVGTHPREHRRLPGIEGVRFVARTSSCAALWMTLSGAPVDVRTMSSSPGVTSSGLLTRREFQVLALIGSGLTTAGMAVRLGISAKTVESRRETLYRKLGVQNQSSAVAKAMETGLLGIGCKPVASDSP